MLSVIIGTVSIILIVTTGVVLYYKDEQIKKDTQSKMQGLVDQINDSQYYEYKFDKKQDQNIKNLDQNITQVYDSVVKLQNNVKYVQENTLLKEDTKKNLNTDKSTIGTLKTNRTTIANNTGKNNIVFEGGRTLDGNNEGWSAMNFNGYYNNGEKRIDGNKSRWRMIADQRQGTDQMVFDQLDQNNKWHQYLMMADGTVGLNNNKLRFSNKWTGFPDNATDRSEISNDTSGFKELMIVGNKSGGGERRVGVWDTLNVHGTLNTRGTINTPVGVNVTRGDPGPLVEKRYNWQNYGDRYGVGQYPGGKMKMYTATTYPGNVSMSLANADGSFKDVVTVNPDTTVDINGPLRVNKGNGDWNWLRVAGNHHDNLYLGSDKGNRGIWADGQRDFTIYNQGNPGLKVHTNGKVNIPDTLKIGQDHGGWTNQAALTTWTPDGGRAGPSFGGPDMWSHFPWFDGNTYIRPGKGGGSINIDHAKTINLGASAINANGPLNISGKWRLGDTGDDWLRMNAPGRGDMNGYAGGFAAGRLWTAQGGLAGSDIRMKDNVNDINQTDVDKLLQLNSKSYNYIDDDSKRQRFGFIAQDVEKLYPDMVRDGANGMKSLNYDDIIPLTVENIKNINKKINSLAPNNKQVCLDGVCLTKDDIIKLKNL